MNGEEIFGPFFGMILLTFVVWVVMYVRCGALVHDYSSGLAAFCVLNHLALMPLFTV